MIKRYIENFYTGLFNRVDSLNFGKHLTIKGIAKPTWKDPRTNLIWAMWLFVNCFKFLGEGLRLKYKYYYNFLWFRMLMGIVFLVSTPIRYIFKAISYIRYIRFIILTVTGAISFIYNPTEIWVILTGWFGIVVSNIDVFLSIFKDKVNDFVGWLFTKVEKSKPNLDKIRENKWMPSDKKTF